MDIKARQRLARLHAMLGSDHAGERENARTKLIELLRQHGKTWNDLPELLQAASAADTSTRNATQGANEESAGPPVPLPLDRLTTMLAEYVQLPAPAYLTIALWIALTFVFERFMVSPRLAFVSPVRGCGKTTVLDLLAALCDRACRCDGISAAGIYRLIDRDRPTLLCDEADTYDLLSNGPLRAVFNSGHRRGGYILRVDGRFATFSPMAVAAIGARSLPFPLLHRSIMIRMTRADGTRPLQICCATSTSSRCQSGRCRVRLIARAGRAICVGSSRLRGAPTATPTTSTAPGSCAAREPAHRHTSTESRGLRRASAGTRPAPQRGAVSPCLLAGNGGVDQADALPAARKLVRASLSPRNDALDAVPLGRRSGQ